MCPYWAAGVVGRCVCVCVGVCEQEVIRPLNLVSIRVDTGVILYRLTPLDASLQIWFVPRSAPINPPPPGPPSLHPPPQASISVASPWQVRMISVQLLNNIFLPPAICCLIRQRDGSSIYQRYALSPPGFLLQPFHYRQFTLGPTGH